MTAFAEGHRLGPYRIVRLLGEGGMGAVYEARQEPLDRRVALKTLHPEYAGKKDAVARFFNEAKVLSRLEHPSIVQASDFGNAADGTAYLVMEYLRGQSLGRRLAEGDGRLPVVTALQLAWQVADVLAVAHAQGIIHRDLKPDNLMLVADPIAPGGERVKVLDFGIAKLTRASDRGEVKTDTLAIMGTPSYMSPEQCAGAGGVDPKTDVYSLGCVLYQTLAGRPPFMAEGAGQLIGKHLFQTPPSLLSVAPKVPTQVADLVHRLLTKNKGQRPSMSDTVDALGLLLSKMPGTGSVVRSRLPISTDPDATRPSAPDLVPLTTMGHSIGQVGKTGTQQRRFVAVGLAGLMLVGATVLMAMLRTPSPPLARVEKQIPLMIADRREAPSAPNSLPATLVAPASIPPVRWAVSTEPAGASVLDEKGRVLGITPWAEEHEASVGIATLRLRHDGFKETTIRLDRAVDSTPIIRLLSIPSPPTKATISKPHPVVNVAPAPPPALIQRKELPVEP